MRSAGHDPDGSRPGSTLLVDAHCHLDDAQFDDVAALVQRACAAGVVAMITAGTDLASSRAALALAEQFEPVYAAVGIHPQHAGEIGETDLEALRGLASHPKAVAIGEIGLDFHYPDGAPRAVQERVFTAQLRLAHALDKPVVIHDRDAHDAVLDLIAGYPGRAAGMLHCFSGDLAMAERAIDLGYRISIAGNVTFANARRLRETVRALPLDRMLIETDAPYLSPQRGRRNEPAHVALVAAQVAELVRTTPSRVAETTWQNSKMLFRLRTVE